MPGPAGRISGVWLLPPASGMVPHAPGGNHFTGTRRRMSSIPSREKPLWARGTARIMGFRTADADRRIGDALAWLEAQCAEASEATGGVCCRALIAGAVPGVRPQITALTLARALADTAARVILVDASQGAGALSGPLELP